MGTACIEQERPRPREEGSVRNAVPKARRRAWQLYGIELNDTTMCRDAEHIGSKKRRALGPSWMPARRRRGIPLLACRRTRQAEPCSLHLGLVHTRKTSGMCEGPIFFVVTADMDHVFVEYQKKHASAAVCEMFKGFRGYIQADAQGVATRNDTCREALMRISEWFDVEEKWRELPPKERHARRQMFTRPRAEVYPSKDGSLLCMGRGGGYPSSQRAGPGRDGFRRCAPPPESSPAVFGRRSAPFGDQRPRGSPPAHGGRVKLLALLWSGRPRGCCREPLLAHRARASCTASRPRTTWRK